MLRKASVIATILVLAALVLPGRTILHQHALAGNLPTVAEAQQQMLPLYEETARLIDPTFTVGHYAGSERATPFHTPNDPFGYDECDYWWNVFRPGWYTMIFTDFPLATVDPSATMDAVMARWSRADGEMTTGGPAGSAPTVLTLEQGSVRYHLRVDQQHGVLSLGASTSACLPVS